MPILGPDLKCSAAYTLDFRSHIYFPTSLYLLVDYCGLCVNLQMQFVCRRMFILHLIFAAVDLQVKTAHSELKEAKESNSLLNRKLGDMKRLMAVSKQEYENAVQDRDDAHSQLQMLKVDMEASQDKIQHLEEEISRHVAAQSIPLPHHQNRSVPNMFAKLMCIGLVCVMG